MTEAVTVSNVIAIASLVSEIWLATGKADTHSGSSKLKFANKNSDRTRQQNKRGDAKWDQTDSPEIPDRWETSESPTSLWLQWKVKSPGYA